MDTEQLQKVFVNGPAMLKEYPQYTKLWVKEKKK